MSSSQWSQFLQQDHGVQKQTKAPCDWDDQIDQVVSKQPTTSLAVDFDFPISDAPPCAESRDITVPTSGSVSPSTPPTCITGAPPLLVLTADQREKLRDLATMDLPEEHIEEETVHVQTIDTVPDFVHKLVILTPYKGKKKDKEFDELDVAVSKDDAQRYKVLSKPKGHQIQFPLTQTAENEYKDAHGTRVLRVLDNAEMKVEQLMKDTLSVYLEKVESKYGKKSFERNRVKDYRRFFGNQKSRSSSQRRRKAVALHRDQLQDVLDQCLQFIRELNTQATVD
jgi:hypothetical protein